MPDKLKLPPGAKLVNDDTPLPPGAKLISNGSSVVSPEVLANLRAATQTPEGGAPGPMSIKAAPQFHMSDLVSWMNPQAPTSPWLRDKLYNIADKGTNAIPAVAGIGGGIAGFPAGGPAGSITGATIGGAGGEAARQLIRRGIFPPSKGWTGAAPDNSMDAAEQIGTEGLKQGAYEAGGQGMRAIGRVLAPKIAEAAVSPGKRLLKSVPDDVNIGKTILQETSGVRPKTIVGQLDSKIAAHSAAEDELLNKATDAGQTISLTPTRRIIAEESGIAKAKNSPSYLRDVNKVNDQLSYEMGLNGKPITRQVQVLGKTQDVPMELPSNVSPVRARQLRQGIDMEIGNWNPEAQSNMAPLQRRVYGSLSGEIHRSIPEVVEHDAAMTNLIPTRDATWNTSFNPSLTRNVVERFARPTGALLGTVVGGEEGYRRGGIAGGVSGAVLGGIAPSAVTTPTGLMIMSRAAESGAPIRALRYAVPIGEGMITKPNAKLENKRPRGTEDEE